jgi:hypothetical protein
MEYGNDEPDSKKQKILYKSHISKSSKPIEKKTTKPRPLFIKVSMKPHLRSLLL